MQTAWTQEKIASLPTEDLLAIVRSTNPAGKFWLELVWAQDELDRRNAADYDTWNARQDRQHHDSLDWQECSA